ncbi:MAG: hypothetical protein AAF682_16830 [Planctomycetota bacterium]
MSFVSLDIRRLVACRDPQWLLEVLAEGDPLELANQCAARLRQRALPLAPAAVAQRALACLVDAARDYSPDTPFDAWLAACIDRAIDDLLSRGPDAEAIERCVDHGLKRGETRRMAARLQALDLRSRFALLEVLLRGESIEDHAERLGLPPEQVLADLRQVLGTLLAK